VNNFNRRELRVIVSATFPFEEKPARIRAFLDGVCAEATETLGEHLITDKAGNYLEPPQVIGVTDITKDERGGVYTIIAKTFPASLWHAERTIREIIWRRSLDEGIRLAYPRRVESQWPE
jgi:small conductance mechanosensitive channel